jgi:hypothetical protein
MEFSASVTLKKCTVKTYARKTIFLGETLVYRGDDDVNLYKFGKLMEKQSGRIMKF